MLPIIRVSRVLVPLAILVVFAGASPSRKPARDARPQNDEILRLIEKLMDVSEGDIGYMPNASGSSFLPLGKSELGAMLLTSSDKKTRRMQKPARSSDTMRELVKCGAAALPQLIAHLHDGRATKITVKHEGLIGGMAFEEEYDYNSRIAIQVPEGMRRRPGLQQIQPNTQHTVTVGDLCFVAIGQIVNRSFNAVRYQPTMCVIVNSPTCSGTLRKAIVKEWGSLTPEQHKASLERDFLEPDSDFRLVGACLRLGYYYPDALEPLALKQLAEPRYNGSKVWKFLRETLRYAKDAGERKKRFDEFVAEHGEVARQAVLLRLWEDFELQEAVEEGRLAGSREATYPARAYLMELFAYPDNVKSKDRPKVYPVEEYGRSLLIGALAHFPTEKIDRAVLQIMHSTENRHVAIACMLYLVGRGADADIRECIERWRASGDEGEKAFRRVLDLLDGRGKQHRKSSGGNPVSE